MLSRFVTLCHDWRSNDGPKHDLSLNRLWKTNCCKEFDMIRNPFSNQQWDTCHQIRFNSVAKLAATQIFFPPQVRQQVKQIRIWLGHVVSLPTQSPNQFLNRLQIRTPHLRGGAAAGIAGYHRSPCEASCPPIGGTGWWRIEAYGVVWDIYIYTCIFGWV